MCILAKRAKEGQKDFLIWVWTSEVLPAANSLREGLVPEPHHVVESSEERTKDRVTESLGSGQNKIHISTGSFVGRTSSSVIVFLQKHHT